MFILLFETHFATAESESALASAYTAMKAQDPAMRIKVFRLGEEIQMEPCWRVSTPASSGPSPSRTVKVLLEPNNDREDYPEGFDLVAPVGPRPVKSAPELPALVTKKKP